MSDYIYSTDLTKFKYCHSGSRAFFRSNGMTDEKLKDFYRNGMLLTEFDVMFGKDAQAKKLIEWVQNGRK